MNIFRDNNLQAEFERQGFAKATIISVPEVEQLLVEISELNPVNQPINHVSAGISLPYHITFLNSNEDYRRRVFQLAGNYFAENSDILFLIIIFSIPVLLSNRLAAA